MKINMLERFFTRMGARVRFDNRGPRPNPFGFRRGASGNITFDVERDKNGEYFLIRHRPESGTEVMVLDVQPADRHLLLMTRSGNRKHRFLLGHDERHWFVAGIPEATPVSQVRDAKRALKPEAVLASEQGLRQKLRDRRRNRARIRQGEWFFVPRPNAPVNRGLILRNEPLLRSGGSKPHICDELCRYGGQTVYVRLSGAQALSEKDYAALSDEERRRSNWRVMRRDPKVYVRGRVRHPDHKTVVLNGWHEVFTNTEHLSYAMRNIVFLD